MTLFNFCCIKPGYMGLVLTQAKGKEDMGEVDTMVPYYKRLRVPYREQKKIEEQEGEEISGPHIRACLQLPMKLQPHTQLQSSPASGCCTVLYCCLCSDCTNHNKALDLHSSIPSVVHLVKRTTGLPSGGGSQG